MDTKFPIKLEIPIAWGDMDAFAHVNNTNYFRFFESARIAYFQATGLAQSRESKAGPILASTRCDFLVPLTFPDTIVAETGVTRLGNSSFTMAYRIFSQAQQKEAARGEGVIVYYDYESGRSEPLPERLRQAIEKLES
ncbi:MAG: acyl-CoA thioesterase [Vulcanimicrobiota bacterium]